MELSTQQRLFLEKWIQHAPSHLPQPEFEHRFAKDDFKRQWRIDVAWPSLKVGFEIEGGAFARRRGKRCRTCGQTPPGRHTSGIGFWRDLRKYNAARALGWVVLQFPTNLFRDSLGMILDEMIAVVGGRYIRKSGLAALVEALEDIQEGDPHSDDEAIESMMQVINRLNNDTLATRESFGRNLYPQKKRRST